MRYDLQMLSLRLQSLADGIGAESWGPHQDDQTLRLAFTRGRECRVVVVRAEASVDEILAACRAALFAWPA